MSLNSIVMSILIKFKQFLILLFVFSIFLYGCSPGDPRSKGPKLDIRLSENSTTQSAYSNEFQRLAQIRFFAVAPPSSTANINCFLANVTGTGIPSQPRLPSDCVVLDNMRGTGFGISSPPTARGSSIELDLPTGIQRHIDIYGFYPDNSIPGCPNSTVEPTASRYGYFLGGTTINVSESTEITIPISTAFATSESFNCGGPSTPVTYSPFVLGQPDFTSSTANNGGISALSLSGTADVYTDGTRLYVADMTNNRILIWNTIPNSIQVAADVVLGQATFTTNAANSGGLSASSLNGPRGVFSDGSKLYVADSGNNRILIWNTIPTANNTAADVVVGQANFTSSGAALTASGLNNPYSVHVTAGKLFIASTMQARVLIWNSVPGANGTAADIVVGQTNFTSGGGGLSATAINMPKAVKSDGTRLYIADSLNHRVLIWNTIPPVNATAADVVVGQANFTTGTSGTTSTKMNTPTSIHVISGKLYVSDKTNSRILIYNTIPTANNTAADSVFGQPNFTSNTPNNGGIGSQSLSNPDGISGTNTHLYISDPGNSRILATPM